MQPETGATQKEATILDLSYGIGELLGDLQERLDNRFDRNPEAIKEGEGQTRPTNVLDEIIAKLNGDTAWLKQITAFISTEVLPKIS